MLPLEAIDGPQTIGGRCDGNSRKGGVGRPGMKDVSGETWKRAAAAENCRGNWQEL